MRGGLGTAGGNVDWPSIWNAVAAIAQAVATVVAVVALIVVALQTVMQSRLMKAQLLRDRFETYWKIYEPVSDAHVSELAMHPEEYMDSEYLAFTRMLKTLKIQDPLGREWSERYCRLHLQDEQFRHVHEAYRGYYPDFETYIDDLLSESARQLAPARPQNSTSGTNRVDGPTH